ncbi:hypothetical protein BCR36DRAFT_317975 [Piromyces finnis]|uniref:Uncharacterized protein n=1 Tax=Piromyces finnis TaxID=1754191 RepID=A0A1Y1VKA3_9FUNG|nr:hypothetical protein BCR36DRAFT_317975 [Piromyces finnis]|eukprot:ORX58514.1 hypothetical protein BCR36DRAFT_317975 [Piromyces finnis]
MNNSNTQNNNKDEGSTSTNKVNIQELINKKPSIFKRRVKKKSENAENSSKGKNKEEEELKKISKEIGNVTGIVKQDELEHNVVNQLIYRSKQNQLAVEEKRLRRAISVANTTSRKIDTNFRKWMNPKTSETEKRNLIALINQLKKDLKSQRKDVQEIQQRIEENKKQYNITLSYSNEPNKFLDKQASSSSSSSLSNTRRRRIYNHDDDDNDLDLMDSKSLSNKINMNYKPRYVTKGPKKEIMVSLPQITEQMKLKHKYLYSEEENIMDNLMMNDIDNDIEINADIKEIQEGSNLNSNDAILNENIQVHTFDSNKRIRYNQFFDQSETEDTTSSIKKENEDDAEFKLNSTEDEVADSEDEYIDVDDNSSDYTPQFLSEQQSNQEFKKKKKVNRKLYSTQHIDDGDEFYYQRRLSEWVKKRRIRKMNINKETQLIEDLDEQELIKNMEQEMFELAANDTEISLGNGYRIPNEIYDKLFLYQQTCIKWLWELHQQEVGGIIGDEMGLGKTIQTISYIYGLAYSGLLKQPVIIVCPATLMKQWVEEFHEWAPPLRVVILHSSGSGIPQLNALSDSTLMEDLDSETEIILNDNFSEDEPEESEDDDDDDDIEDYHYAKWKLQHRKRKKKRKHIRSRLSKKNLLKFKRLIDRVKSYGHVLITTYEGLRTYKPIILSTEWSYAFLDEGHKIRNPDSDITLLCKQLKTPHRILLSGTPIQNSLKELWSLFDFIYPGRLGTLPMFIKLFEIPIKMGGYANASNQEIKTSIKCATALRDSINPYLLRRLKIDVASDLPKKSEHVLFCTMTPEQKANYKAFIESAEANEIYGGKRNVLYGIDILRKICNHPDLLRRKIKHEIPDYGYYKKSGKMVVVKGLLKTWYESNNKVLLFCQTRQMMEILELFLQQKGYTYRKMDGETPIKTRVFLVDEFNNNKDIFIFLLTTKVGGLGINLCSANRIIIYDPDWNPSTDMQARERAWRLGQKRDVAIFRIMAKGTVEEKIYHRQIYKQFLTNKILIDPNHQRFFKQDDLMDLFSYNDNDDDIEHTKSMTGKILKNMDMDVEINKDDIKQIEKDLNNMEEEQNNNNNKKMNQSKHLEMKIKQPTNDMKENSQEGISITNNNINNMPLINEQLVSSNNGENTSKENISRALESSETKKKREKKYSCDSIDNSIKQSKYNQVSNQFLYDDHENLIKKEISNIEGIEYSEDFKPPNKEDDDDNDDIENDLFTQSEDENSDSDHKHKRKRSKKGKQEDKKGLSSNTADDIDNIEFENDLKDKSREYQSKDELRVLKNLMKITGAVSVIEHDKIMDSKKWSDIRDDKEAERIANSAVRKLRKFMEKRRHIDISIPTWTGSSGFIGSDKPKKPLFGQKVNPLIAKRNLEMNPNNDGSDSIKAMLMNRNRQNSEMNDNASSASHSRSSSFSSMLNPTPSSSISTNHFGKGKVAGFSSIQISEDIKTNGLTSNTLISLLQQKNAQIQAQEENINVINGIGITDKEELILTVRDFILNHENQRVTSKEIINHFKMKTSKKDIELIRRMLQRICIFQRDDNTKAGYWILKDEFKE